MQNATEGRYIQNTWQPTRCLFVAPIYSILFCDWYAPNEMGAKKTRK